MSEFPGSIDYFVDRSRVFPNQNTHSAIVCHGTGGSANQTVEQLGDYFRTNSLITSVHYGIGRDGRIAQYVLESDGAGGNCCVDGNYDPFWNQFPDNKNLHTLSFETINDSANSLPLTDPQKQTVFKLIKYWVDKYHIPIANIKSHASLDPINRSACPGPNFPWDELWSYLNGEEMMTINLNTPRVSDYFQATNDATVWKCKKTGFLIGHSILSFYQKFGGDALCGVTYLGLPLNNETAVSGYPGVVYQRFERGVLAYDPQHTIDSPPDSGNVYCMHIDSGLGQDPRIALLQAQIAQWQQSISALAQQTLPTSQSSSAPAAQILPTTQSSPTSTNQSQQT